MSFLSSCENYNLADEGNGEGTGNIGHASSVRILTRGAEGTSLDYPLHVYAFAPDGKLVAQQLMEDPSDELRLSVPQDADTRIVVVSADPCVYELPANPTKSSLITMRDDVSGKGADRGQGYSPKALQMGYVNLHPRTDNSTVSIQMYFKVLSLEATLTDMPETCSSAYLSVESPASAISLAGELQGTQVVRIPLYRDQEGQQGRFTTGRVFLFPTFGDTRFTITYNDDQGEQSSTADYQAPLIAGTPYRLNGTYDDGCIHVSGTVTPSEWSDPVDIDFDFGNSSSTTIGGSGEIPEDWMNDTTVVPVSYIPMPFTTWENHLVIAHVDANEGEESGTDASTATLLLLSRSESGNHTSAFSSEPTKAQDAADEYEEESLSGWRIPSSYEANLLSQIYRDDQNRFNLFLVSANAAPVELLDSKGKGIRYLCEGATKTFAFNQSGLRSAGSTVSTYRLRLVRTVRVRVDGGKGK